ncbi:hypothetical protein Sme01_31940 [Sphaerisporangium melleum]|uniref:Uncharacterized protein n=1 Tax=Sphaerisporangium melleum TaxID=321316 RepID=A0A917VMN8_9ACTN|nr:hypothetical protein GCM10007964_43360 [Sphaerisporangium melleum]GII70718.1 hypothetical protein Sme01_31940 [Sphaerisporangium melleum]
MCRYTAAIWASVKFFCIYPDLWTPRELGLVIVGLLVPTMRRIGQVGGDAGHPVAELVRFRHPWRLAGDAHHHGALTRERAHRGRADAGRGAGDDEDLAGQPQVHRVT